MVEDALSYLAQKHDHTRFVKLPYQDAEMAVEAVPAILAYRAGDIIANLVSVIDEIPAGQDMSASILESLLRRYGFRTYPTSCRHTLTVYHSHRVLS